MTKTEREVVNLSKPTFYKRFEDDIINKRNKDEPDDLTTTTTQIWNIQLK